METDSNAFLKTSEIETTIYLVQHLHQLYIYIVDIVKCKLFLTTEKGRADSKTVNSNKYRVPCLPKKGNSPYAEKNERKLIVLLSLITPPLPPSFSMHTHTYTHLTRKYRICWNSCIIILNFLFLGLTALI